MTQADLNFDVVIVGGGVAGSGLAAALHHLQADVRVLLIEQSRKSGAIDRGDMIWPPHMELLDRWGVLPEIERRGAVPMRGGEFYDNGGRLLLRHGYGFFGSRFDHVTVLEHPQIEEALLHVASANPNLTVWRGARFEGLAAHDETGATLRLQREHDTVHVRTSWVVAADGRTSRVREEAGISSPMRPYQYDLLMTYTPKDPRWSDTCAQFQGPHGFLGLFVVNGSHNRVAFPLPSGSFTEFMALSEAQRHAAMVRRAPQMANLPVLWERTHCYKLFEHHAPTYHRGRVILMGDTAHTFTPMLGMGMNLALEDADCLAPLLASRQRLAGLDGGVLARSYEGPRRQRNQKILAASTRQGGLQVAGNALYQWAYRSGLRAASHWPSLAESAMRSLFA